jgi:hypothetical protein
VGFCRVVFGRPAPLHARPSDAAPCRLTATSAHPNAYPGTNLGVSRRWPIVSQIIVLIALSTMH